VGHRRLSDVFWIDWNHPGLTAMGIGALTVFNAFFMSAIDDRI